MTDSELISTTGQRRGGGEMYYEPYNEETASVKDRVAWVLCQIIDDDAPVRWTRYRFAAECIAKNDKLMTDLKELSKFI